MTSRIQHRRQTATGAALPGLPLKTGELALNLADLQIFTSSGGAPLPMVGVRYFSATAVYAIGDIVVNGGTMYSCTTANGPGAFSGANWASFTTTPAGGGYLPLAGGSLTGPGNLSVGGTLGVSGIASFALGSAGAPSITFTGDLDTGMWSPGSNMVAWSQAGTERMRMDASGNFVRGHTAGLTFRVGSSNSVAGLQNVSVGISAASMGEAYFAATASGPAFYMGHSRGATIGDFATVVANDVLGQLSFNASDSVKFVEGARIHAVAVSAAVDSVPAYLAFSTTPPAGVIGAVERMRLNELGHLLLGTTTGTDGRIRIGGSPWLTTAAQVYGILVGGNVPSSAATAVRTFSSQVGTDVAAFTLVSLNHFAAGQGTFGAGSAVTSQYGFIVESTMIGAANNYGFYGNIPAAANRYNLYMGGTAQNYLGGVTGIGMLPLAASPLVVGGGSGTQMQVLGAAGIGGSIEFGGNGQTLALGTSFAVGQDNNGDAALFQRANKQLYLGTNGIHRVDIAAAGNVVVNPPTSGIAFAVTGLAGQYAAKFTGSVAAGALTTQWLAAGIASWTAGVTSGGSFRFTSDNITLNVMDLQGSGGVVIYGVPAAGGNELRVIASNEAGVTCFGILSGPAGNAEQFFVAHNLQDVLLGNKRQAVKLYAYNTVVMTWDGAYGYVANQPAAGDSTTKIANTGFVQAAIGTGGVGMGTGAGYVDRTASRSAGTAYGTGGSLVVGRTRFVSVQITIGISLNGSASASVTPSGGSACQCAWYAATSGAAQASNGTLNFCVPPGATYQVTVGGSAAKGFWVEMD